jgi:6-pyruvoyltetrahydropterin/6-carboxytetrahydropterin synthase
MTCLTRRYCFSASHRLHTGRLDAEQNRRVFGKCNRPYGHGHNYFLEVTVAGEIDAQTGLLAPGGRLDALVRRAVLERLDHTHLNDLPAFQDCAPTTENLGLLIGRWLAEGEAGLSPARLARLRIEETGANSVEIDLHGL